MHWIEVVAPEQSGARGKHTGNRLRIEQVLVRLCVGCETGRSLIYALNQRCQVHGRSLV